jgi:hypothetical protein
MTLTTDLDGETLLQALRATPAPEYLVTEPDGAIFGVLAAADVEHAFLLFRCWVGRRECLQSPSRRGRRARLPR